MVCCGSGDAAKKKNGRRTSVRRFEIWPGNNVLLCRGRLILGPDWRTCSISFILIIVPMVIYGALILPWLWMSPVLANFGWIFTVVAAIGFFLTYLMLFITGTMDPGIIPRNPHPPEEDEQPSGTTSSNVTPIKRAKFKEVVVNGETFRMKYCYTCNIYRPPRCSHCSICDNCVECFDHHCPWTGTCIGLRNYRFFYLFNLMVVIMCIYVPASSILLLVLMCKDRANAEPDHKWYDYIWKAFLKYPWSWIGGVILTLYCAALLFSVGGLFGFHSYLICTNQTTHEELKKQYRRRKNPYSRGAFYNVISKFCTKLPESQLRLNEIVPASELFDDDTGVGTGVGIGAEAPTAASPNIAPMPSTDESSTAIVIGGAPTVPKVNSASNMLADGYSEV